MGTAVIRWLARAICWIFYRVDREGAVPADGPVLILPNHPNALLDPAVIWATAGRDVCFLAKSTLFDGAFAPVLRMARAIPVYRRLDQGVDPSRNSETFAAVDAALAGGSAVCIFPEGVSHSTGRLRAPHRRGSHGAHGGTPRHRRDTGRRRPQLRQEDVVPLACDRALRPAVLARPVRGGRG